MSTKIINLFAALTVVDWFTIAGAILSAVSLAMVFRISNTTGKIEKLFIANKRLPGMLRELKEKRKSTTDLLSNTSTFECNKNQIKINLTLIKSILEGINKKIARRDLKNEIKQCIKEIKIENCNTHDNANSMIFKVMGVEHKTESYNKDSTLTKDMK